MQNVICLEDPAFYKLVEIVVQRLKAENNIKEDKWLTTEEAMKKLNISSKTTLQKLRNEGMIAFTNPSRKVILYDRGSIDKYLDKHTKETF